MFSLMGRPQVPGPPRSVELPSIDPTADGWVGFNTNGAQHFRAFAELVGRPDLVGHPQFGNIAGRMAERAEWDEIVRAYTEAHTTAEVLSGREELRVPAARVNDGHSVLTEEQLIAREFYATDPATRRPRQPAPALPAKRPAARSRPARRRSSVPTTRQICTRAAGDHRSPPTGALPLDGRESARPHGLVGRSGGLAAARGDGRRRHPRRVAHASGSDAAGQRRHVHGTRPLVGVQRLPPADQHQQERRHASTSAGDGRPRRCFAALVEWADVVVENYTPAGPRAVGDGLGSRPRASTRRR